MIFQLNNIHYVLFAFTYLLILFAMGGRVICLDMKSALHLREALAFSVIYVISFMLSNLLFCMISDDIQNIFSNQWSVSLDVSQHFRNPLEAGIASLVLFFLRTTFCIYLMDLVNTIFRNKYYGFWAILLLSFIDFRLYEILSISTPFNILPFEHTVLMNSELYESSIGNYKISIFFSLLYWMLLIAVLYTLMIVVKKIREKRSQYGV